MGTNSRQSLTRREQDAFREVLRAARIEAGLTQHALAQKVGLPSHAITKIEGGQRLLDVVEFIDIADAVGSNPIELLKQVLGKR